MVVAAKKPKIANRAPHQGCPDRGFGHVGQVQIIRACLEFKNVVAVLGRSAGKTALCPFLAYEEARLYSGYYELAYTAPTNRFAKQQFRAWKKIFRALIDPAETWDVDQIITLKPFGQNMGVRMYFWGLDEHENLRGPRLCRLIVDERKDVFPQAITDTLAPMLMGRQGKTLHIGTPKRTGRGAASFRQDFLRGQDPDNQARKTWISFTAPSHCNPHLTDDEIQDLIDRQQDERSIREEIYAEFLEDDGAVFSNFEAVFDIPAERIKTFKVQAAGDKVICAPCDPHKYPNLWIAEPASQGTKDYHPDRYGMGLDLGMKQDHTIASGFNLRTKRQAFLLRLSRMDYADQLPLIDWLVSYYDAFTVFDGSPHGAVVTNALAKKYGDRCIPRTWNARTKIEDITRAQILCAGAGRDNDDPFWHLMDIPFQRNEWESYAVTTETKDGRRLKTPLYGAPIGMHDDTVAAGCLIAENVSAPFIRRKRAPEDPIPFSGRWLKEQDKRKRRQEWWDRVSG